MTKTGLTDRLIKNAKAGSNTIRFRDNSSDPALKGFMLQILPSGLKTFVLSYTSPESGTRRFIKLGTYPAMSLKEGREAARQSRQILDKGLDPIAYAEQLKLDALTEQEKQNKHGTVEELFKFYLLDLEMDLKRAVKQVKSIYGRDIGPCIGHLKCCEVSSEHIIDIIATIENRGAPTLANRTRAYLRAAFTFGQHCKASPRWKKNKELPDFNISINPVIDTKKAPGENRVANHHLNKEDVRKLWCLIGVAAMSPDMALAIKLLIATGQRVEEVLCAAWAEFDQQELLWTIPAERRKNRGKNKSKEPHLVPLTEFHFHLLDEIKQYSGTSRFLFPHHLDASQPRTSDSLSQAVSRFCSPQGKSKRESFPKFAPRDLRRTWKTLAGSIGIGLEVRNKIQGHAFQDIGSIHYDRYDYLKEKRLGIEQWTHWLEALISQ
ncbi:site-specific integrase [Methylicorpusculum sp.]|uniref:tyrosine-type recombinase/integrase n=1 Tax=Methylicorpusculum sp. TaxID=2713644 RepID=UPI002719DBAF|nr:site-specific integrase [Methylicorpusculum sp.]MDO8844618.1 integrase arm-type DNA-binding domain-containing protein [Methylicorpusculum sp.]